MLLRSFIFGTSLALMASFSFAQNRNENLTAVEVAQLMLDAQHALSQVDFPSRLIVHSLTARELSLNVTEYTITGVLNNGCVLGPNFELKLTRELFNAWPGGQRISAEFTTLIN